MNQTKTGLEQIQAKLVVPPIVEVNNALSSPPFLPFLPFSNKGLQGFPLASPNLSKLTITVLGLVFL